MARLSSTNPAGANQSVRVTVINGMSFPEQILTNRLRLRPPVLEDAEQIFARYGQDPAVAKYLHWTPHRSIDETLAFLRRITDDNTSGRSSGYLIFNRESNTLLGSVGGTIEGHRVQFGYCLARDAWGCGFATEGAQAFVNAMLAEPAILRIQAFCDVENVASARVLEKAGLTREGTLLRYMVMPNLGPAPRDLHLYAKVKNGGELPAAG
jgi:RimJ/RimL family protein N-acetyltransferase